MSTSQPVKPDPMQSSGASKPFWAELPGQFISEPVNQDLQTDIIVIGAGIGGLSTAYALLQSGKKVIVVEDGFIGSGESGRTTAHITPVYDDRYSYIEKKFGKEKAALLAESQQAALAWIEELIHRENIDCDFKTVDGYLFLHPSDKEDSLSQEYDAARHAGLDVQEVDKIPSIANVGGGLKFPRNAQFHIMKYLYGLARAIEQKGGKIFTGSRAESIKDGQVRVNGHTLKASHIVVATNTPFNDLVTMHTKQHPYRSYVIGAEIGRDKISPALWWDTGDQDSTWITQPYHYVRTADLDELHYLLIVGGEDHKTGQPDKEGITEEERFVRLEEWARQHFPAMSTVKYKWSGQVMEPVDGIAFIGKNPGDDNVYIITGDSGNGMTNATLGALIIPDLVNGKENKWSSLYDPARLMFRAPLDFADELLNMVAQFGDYLTRGDIDSIEELQGGEGAILGRLKKFAVYRDPQNGLKVFSAVCPHLGCILQWNKVELSFDCPCHGSRFTCEGKLMNGPANKDLEEVRNGKLETRNSKL